MKKTINCHCDKGSPSTVQRWEHNTRQRIKSALDILEAFGTEEGMDDFCDYGSIDIRLGTNFMEHSATFCPEMWDELEDFLMTSVCYEIQSEELDKYPYYKDIFDRFSAKLGRDDFVY